jgi:hypothetical protein
MSFVSSPQSIKLLLARGEADTDLVTGIADAVVKIPGTFEVDPEGDLTVGRVISGGFGCFSTQEAGDYLTIELRDDDNHLGYGAGTVLETFHDLGTPAANSGWYFLGNSVMNLHPVIVDDPTSVPAGMYLHILGHKAVVPDPAHTLYINLHWGTRLR